MFAAGPPLATVTLLGASTTTSTTSTTASIIDSTIAISSRSALEVPSMITHILPAGLRFRLAMVGGGFMCAATTGTKNDKRSKNQGRRLNNSAFQLTDREHIPALLCAKSGHSALRQRLRYSITSSAATSRWADTPRPCALAVLRLTVVSNLVGA